MNLNDENASSGYDDISRPRGWPSCGFKRFANAGLEFQNYGYDGDQEPSAVAIPEPSAGLSLALGLVTVMGWCLRLRHESLMHVYGCRVGKIVS